MIFADRLTLDAPKRLKDGYMAVRAKAARTGVYDYAGREVDPTNEHGLRDTTTVKVLRDAETVFDPRSAHSFIGKPITDDHPTEPVTSDNWKKYARGTVMGAEWQEGGYLAFDLMLTDAEAIAKIDAGKRELSNGYAADLEFGDFTAPDGTKCQARQTKISGNHVALVDRGRAGSECAIKDAAVCDALTADRLDELKASLTNDGGGTMPHTLTVDGLQVPNVSDEAKACIEKLQGQLKDEQDGRAADKSEHDKAMAAKDKDIDDLKAKTVDQAKIDELADAKAAVVADAKQIAGDKLGDTAGKTVAEVRKMAVAAKLGDAAVSDKSDDYIEARFDGLKDGSPDTQTRDRQPGPLTQIANDTAAVRDLAAASRYA